VPVRFAVADLYDLPYPEKAFDCLFLTNIAYSYVFTRRRRMRLLEQAYSILRPGGVFILSFAAALGSFPGQGISQWLFMKLKRVALFNRDYEPGDRVCGSFVHFFQPEELRQEFDEAKFLVTEWLWDEQFAVLAKK
jgi:SAM-dependent methyltransferase